MPADNNKLELVVEVDVNKANASIKSVNTGLSSMEQAASKAAHGASAGIDGMTASMVSSASAQSRFSQEAASARLSVQRRSYQAVVADWGVFCLRSSDREGTSRSPARQSEVRRRSYHSRPASAVPV